MSDAEAREANVGGEILCQVFEVIRDEVIRGSR